MIATILVDFDDIKNEEQRNKEMKENWGEFVKNMRLAAGLTKVKFAELLGISPNSIKQYEKGKAFPRNPEELELRIRRVVKIEIEKNRKKEQQLRLAI